MPNIRISDTNLPRNWSNNPKAKGIICEGDVGVYGSRIKAKVLVFNTKTNLNNFWKKCLKKESIKGASGAVNSMQISYSLEHVVSKEKRDYSEVDKNYFCVIGLVKSELHIEIIIHESVHAGFCYQLRRGNKDKWHNGFDNDSENMALQEEVAYPTGSIAVGIIKLLQDNKLI